MVSEVEDDELKLSVEAVGVIQKSFVVLPPIET